MRRKRKQILLNSSIRFVSELFILYPLFTLTTGPQTPGLLNPVTGSTFEEVLYGGDSDSEAEGDEDGASRGRKRGDVHGGSRLRNDNDHPMDLLDSVVTRVTSKLKPLPPILSNICFRRHSLEKCPQTRSRGHSVQS